MSAFAEPIYTSGYNTPFVDIAILFSLGALICAACGLIIAVLIYQRPPRWIKGLLPSASLTPDTMGKAAAAFAREFFKGATATDDEGNVVELEPDQAAFQWAQGLVVTATDHIYNRGAQDLPIFLATMKSSKLAKELADKSHVAKGMALLGPGIGGLQTLQDSLGGLLGGKKGKAGGGLGDIMQYMQLLPMLKELGAMGGGDNGGLPAPSQPQTQSSFNPRLGR